MTTTLTLALSQKRERGINFAPMSVLSQKFGKEAGGLPTVMPAKAGIQKQLIFLDSGSR